MAGISAHVDVTETVRLSMAKGGSSTVGYVQVYLLDKDEAIAWRDALNEAFPEEVPDE